MKPSYWNQAKRELSKKDPLLKKVISSYHGEFLTTRGNAYETLLRSIVGQQISVKAAQSVWDRLSALIKKPKPEFLLKYSVAELRSCGLSERKAQYCIDLSKHFLEKKVHPKKWFKMSDEEIIQELIVIKGIGRWTSEMFLIFHLLRPNVFPEDDLGLHKAISLLYQKKYPLSKTNLKKFRKIYDPWASVATWYLWRSLDPIPVEY